MKVRVAGRRGRGRKLNQGPVPFPLGRREQSFYLVQWLGCVSQPPLSPRAARLLGSWSSWPHQPAAPSGQEVAFPVCAVMSEKND